MVKRLILIPVIGFVLIASAGIAHAAGDDAAKTQPALPTVVVLDYQAEMPGEKDLGWKLAEILAARLSIEDSLQLVERAQLSKIIKEQQLKLEGILDQDQAAKVGKLLGAKLMVMGKAFVLNKKFIIVTKVVGVETGRVKGTVREVELKKPISDTVTLLAEDIAALIKKNYASLLPPGSKRDDPTAKIRKKLGDRAPLVVAVVVPETHLTRIIATPAAETEIKRTLIECGFRVVDTGKVDLSDWAKAVYRGKRLPWPASLKKADVVIVGKASSRFTLRTGDLVTSTGKAQVDLIDRHTGKTLLTRRATSQAVDLAEITAGKTALQKAGRNIGLAIARHLVALKTSAKKPITKAPTRKPTAKAPAAKAAEAPKRTLFTAPFENTTGQEQYDPAAAGLGDLVAVMLAQQKHIAVVERQEVYALTAEQARSLKGLTGQEYAVRAGKLLKADTIITGRLFLIQDKLTVSVKALDIASARVVAADQVSCRPEFLMEAALQIARKLGKQMTLPLPDIDLAEIDKSPIAGLHFAKALGHYYSGNMDAAIMQFMRTIDLDPNYTEIHYWSGMCYHRLNEFEYAIIEWTKFLKEHPKSIHTEQVNKLLAEAKVKAREPGAQIKRLGPKSKSAEEGE